MTCLAASKTTVLVSEDEELFGYVAPLIIEVDEAEHMPSGKIFMLRWKTLSNTLPKDRSQALADCPTPPYLAIWGGGGVAKSSSRLSMEPET